MSKLGLTTVAVIHQPRSEIFMEIDDILLLLPGGKTGYLGPRQYVVNYFENLGYVFDPEKNPADILMDIVSLQVNPVNATRPMSVSELAHEWEFYKRYGVHTADAVLLGHKENYNHHISFDSDRTSFHAKRLTSIMEIDSTPKIVVKKSMPHLHQTLSRTMSKKNPQPPVIQEASLEELLVVCRLRGSSFMQQMIICFIRSIVQQYRRLFGLVWEFFVAGTCGFLIGLSMKDLDGIFYRGVLVSPYQSLSAAPLETFVPQCGLILGMGICIAAAVFKV
jgi:hypothetical protein